MYGEKEEEVSELKMDLEDVKQMYKQQVTSTPHQYIHTQYASVH